MTAEQVSQHLVRAWFGPRFVALFIDWLIFAVLWMVAGFWLLSSFMPSSMLIAPNPGVLPVEMFGFMAKAMWTLVAANGFVFGYFVIMETWRGATFGKVFAGIRTVDLSNPQRCGLPFLKAFLRELVKVAGMLPGLVLFFIVARAMSNVTDMTSLMAIASSGAMWGALQFAAQLLPLIWLAWIGVSLVNNKDPIYDRLSATAVIRT